MSFEIKRCTGNDYEEMLAVLNRAFFGYGPGWFQRNMPHCTPLPQDATDSEIGCHYIAVMDKMVVGTCGAYPMEWVVAGETLPIFGIGQVSCLPVTRGRGVMSGLVQRAIEDCVNNGAVLSYLSGDRFRYQRFGYGFGTVYVEYKYDRPRLEQMVAPVQGRRAGVGDIPQLNALYTTLPSYITRSEHVWKRHLGRYNYEFMLAENAYVGFMGNEAVEAAGEPAVVLGLTAQFMKDKQLGLMNLRGPQGADTALARALAGAAASINLMAHEHIAIHKPDELARAFKQAYNSDVRALFSQPFHQVSNATPLCAWLPTADCI